MDNYDLPVSTKKRSITGEQISISNSQVVTEEDKQREHEIKMEIVKNLPAMIDIAKNIVEIVQIREKTESTLKLLDKEIERLNVEADNFIKQKIEERASFKEKADAVANLLKDLYSEISKTQTSDDIKKELIKTFDSVTQKLLETK